MRRFSLFSFGNPSPFFLMSFFSLACGGDEKPIDSGDEPGYPPITETPTLVTSAGTSCPEVSTRVTTKTEDSAQRPTWLGLGLGLELGLG